MFSKLLSGKVTLFNHVCYSKLTDYYLIRNTFSHQAWYQISLTVRPGPHQTPRVRLPLRCRQRQVVTGPEGD